MGLYDTIYAKLKCPVVEEETELEIQVKFTNPYYNGADKTCMRVFRVGDQLPHGPLGNLWMPKEEGHCKKCGTYKNVSRYQRELVSPSSHDVYIHLDNGRILEIILQEEFDSRLRKGEIKDFVLRYGDYQACISSA